MPACTKGWKSSTAACPDVRLLARSPTCPPLSCQQPCAGRAQRRRRRALGGLGLPQPCCDQMHAPRRRVDSSSTHASQPPAPTLTMRLISRPSARRALGTEPCGMGGGAGDASSIFTSPPAPGSVFTSCIGSGPVAAIAALPPPPPAPAATTAPPAACWSRERRVGPWLAEARTAWRRLEGARRAEEAREGAAAVSSI